MKQGPLGPYVDELVRLLREKWYSFKSIRTRFAAVHQLAAWLIRNDIELAELSDQRREQFIRFRKRKLRHHRNGDRITLGFLFEILRHHKVVPEFTAVEKPESEVEEMVGAFKQYLQEERGLSSLAVLTYGNYAHRFLAERFGSSSVKLSKWAELAIFSTVLGVIRSKILVIQLLRIKIGIIRSSSN